MGSRQKVVGGATTRRAGLVDSILVTEGAIYEEIQSLSCGVEKDKGRVQ